MSLPDITKEGQMVSAEGQMVSALQDIVSALEHIACAIDTYNSYRFGIAIERDPKATKEEKL